MKNTIDCLLIGHNEMNFVDYEAAVRRMGERSGAYRDLGMNFIHYNQRPYTISEMFNVFYAQNRENSGSLGDFHVAESFSAAIAYLGSYLNRLGITVDFVNSFQQQKQELIDKLIPGRVLSVAIVTTFYVSVLPILEIIELVRSHSPGTKIILGGPFVSTMVRNLDPEELQHLFFVTLDADVYIDSSQGEATLAKVIAALEDESPLGEIANLYYKSNGRLKFTPVQAEVGKLSENPVDWQLFAGHTGPFVNLRTAISCPFSCSFCGFPQHAGKYQTVDVEIIEAELKQLQRIGTVQSLHFIDDTFNIPAQRFKEILRMMIKNRFSFRWHSYFRCQYADKETVQLMKESGCEGVFLGIESGDDQILKNMNKAATSREYLRGIELLKEQDITTFGCFITGFPGETDQSIRNTVNFIEYGGLDFYRTQLWYCEPITPIWQEKDRYQIKGTNFEWSHHTMDSQTACDRVEEMFTSIKNSTWIPQYNFDFDSLWHLTLRGMNLGKIRTFIEGFNRGVAEKLAAPGYAEVDYSTLEIMSNACLKEGAPAASNSKEAGTPNAHYQDEFDF